MEEAPLFTNDAVVLGLMAVILALVFKTSESDNPAWKKFYKYVPALLLCYFVPSIFNSLGVIDGESSALYSVSSRYLLPASLVLFTLSVDIKQIGKLGGKAVIMFFAGTIGVIIGGPISILIVHGFMPEVFENQEVWRGLSTVAGSWIGGSANQAAMLKVFEPDMGLFSQMIAVDLIIANIWLGFLLYWSKRPEVMDRLLKADSSNITTIQQNIEEYRLSIMRIPTLADTMIILGVSLGVTGLAHYLADIIAPWIELNYAFLADYSLTSRFFWLVIIATIGGLVLSFTKLRLLEGAGASRIGSAMLYILIASVGMQMDITQIVDNPGFFVLGLIWILTHVIIMIFVAWLIRAPFFFVAIGSQANIGGAASAPVVAASFHPALAPVGVLLAVLGYVVGTIGAYACGLLMQWVSSSL